MRRDVAAAPGQLHLIDEGAGEPLVLLHQVPTSSTMWSAAIPGFVEAGFRVLAFDLPGYGMSDPFSSPPSLAEYASAIADGLKAIGLNHVALVGHHTGASVGLQLAVDRPQLVRALALWGIPLLDADFAKRLADEEPPCYDADGSPIAAWWSWRWQMAGPLASQRLVMRSLADTMRAGERRAEGHWAVGQADHTALLRAVAVPLLGMAGDREMLAEQTRQAVALVPRACYVDLGDAGLDVVDEMPDRFVATVVGFLRTGAA